MTKRDALLALLLIVSGHLARAAEPTSQEAVRADEERRHEALVRDGYNLTYGFQLSSEGPTKAVSFEFIIPTSNDGEHLLSLWMEAVNGEAFVRVVGPDAKPQIQWTGRRGELTLARGLVAGKYLLEISLAGAKEGQALFGVKGPVLAKCESDPTRVREIAAAPALGFHWPYLLFVPKQVTSTHLLIIPNNTGFPSEDLDLLRASGSCQLRREGALAERLGTAMLLPLFPRPSVPGEEENLYLHALNRASLETKVVAWMRVDLQLSAMIDDARKKLRAEGVDAAGKVLLSGFSASGMFVNRFALIHPDKVLAVASGSPGGWPTAPVPDVDGEALPYPVGTADLGQITGPQPDNQELRRVRWFFFLGDRDENDAVLFRDSFSKQDEALVLRRFGPKPVARWKKAERLFARAGLNARFALYPGVGHSVTPAMQADIERFFLDAQKAP